MSRSFRRLRFGLLTLLGLRRLGFFIPYRYAGSVEPLDYPALHPAFEASHDRFRSVLEAIETHAEDLGRILEGRGPARFDQGWFPRLDAAVAYALVRREKPKRIVEIGSGHSTRFMAQAVEDGALPTRITCIDPAPRAVLGRVKVEHKPVLLRDADPGYFEELGVGDILFIDSSHIAMPGTDVDRLFLDVLPRLAAGVLVHVHDITLPYAYPKIWDWRAYNEQLLVGALLQGRGYELVFASHYVSRDLPQALNHGILARLPLEPGAHETSLWLRKL
ncbi:class I SAM-dependent methyltransferase [Microvirga roseola]|uniref:class I SAM-dependent methyltransferase n=1 Tax=Microvirga roseola TaxID=2883126 RepID=UPI001E3C878A|nr:class I SAM-dependent methyltransferase [Microvirga roseola]